MKALTTAIAAGVLVVACGQLIGLEDEYRSGGAGEDGNGGVGGSAGKGTAGKGGASGRGGSANAGSANGGSANGGSAGSSVGSGGSSGDGAGGSANGGEAGDTTAEGGTGGSTGGNGGVGGGSGGKGGSAGNGGGAGKGGGAGSNATGGNGGTGGSGGASGGMSGSGGGGMGGSGGAVVVGPQVHLGNDFQTIQGFGLNTGMMPSSETIPIDTVFDTAGTDGIGLSILRVGMTPSGALTGKYVTEAKAKGAKVIGTVYSPPASCKSNSSTIGGGALQEACYESWSDTIAAFAQAQGLYAMSIGNEPDFASCASDGPPCTSDYDTTTFTGKQMVAWVKVAGVKLIARGVKVIAPEVAEWNHAWSNASATGSLASGHPNSSDPLNCGCFSNTLTETGCDQNCIDGNGYDYGHWLWKDLQAWESFDIFGVHEYDSQTAYRWPDDVNGGLRNKEVWVTEMSGLRYWPEEGPSTNIDNGLAVAGWIHSALTVGEASAWLYYWYESYYQNDNEGLALIQGTSTIAKRYYTLGQYSKFVRPGYIAVEVTGNADPNLLLSAFKNAGATTIVVVAVNKGSAAASPMITFTGGTAPTSCTPNVTSAADNLKAGSAVTVSGGVLAASLAGKTVTTYVCN